MVAPGLLPLAHRAHGPASRSCLAAGKLYRRTGKDEQAEEHLTIATTMYREMDMRFWLEQAEVESMEPGA